MGAPINIQDNFGLNGFENSPDSSQKNWILKGSVLGVPINDESQDCFVMYGFENSPDSSQTWILII